MKIYSDYILEAQIDGLKNVKTIRHYTTGASLKKILRLGYIEARESEGDEQWSAYDLHDYKVVSFHDERTDPEWDDIIEYNNRKMSIDGWTYTLGLHAKKICACIEIDYEKIDNLIQNKTHLLNIYEKKAKEFAYLWNWIIQNKVTENGILALTKCKLELTKLMLNIYYDNNEELKKSFEFILDYYSVKEKCEQPEGKLAANVIRKIFSKYYTDDELNKIVSNDNQFRNRNNWEAFYINLSACILDIPQHIPQNDNDVHSANQYIKQLNAQVKFYSRKHFKIFTDDEIEKLSEYCVKFDVVSVIKMMRSHGWEPGDSELGGNIFNLIRLPARYEDKYYDGTLLMWVDKLLKNANKIVNADIEIRIPSNVEINKDNCRILIFDGLCEATKQEYLTRLPKKYYDMYNIEHIKPNE